MLTVHVQHTSVGDNYEHHTYTTITSYVYRISHLI
jgi:hypothetical protein